MDENPSSTLYSCQKNMKNSFIITLSAVLVTVNCASKVLSECGIPKIGGKELITHGQDTDPGDWPWHAAIFHSKGTLMKYVCGGTIINEEFIVTAAHCVIDAKNGFPLAPSRITVRLGVHDLLEINPAYMQQHRVEKVFKFDNFIRLVDDIALIKLSTIILFTDYVQPACMNVEPDIIGRYGTVVGWGLTENDETSPILKKVDVPVIDPVACLKTDRVLFGQTMDDGLFCAGYTNGTGVCNGDSGGGLFFQRTEAWFLGGIVSFSQTRSVESNRCYLKGYAAFTKVQHYISWISEITGMSFQQNNVPRNCKSVEPIQTGMSSKLLPRQCGVYIPNRIIDGTNTKVFQFPWMALLMVSDTDFICAGTLISKRYILTLSQCFNLKTPTKVCLGEHTLGQDIDCNESDKYDCAPPVRYYNIECYTTHPGYSPRLRVNDIGLVRLSEDVQYEDHILPICLPHTPDLRSYQPPRYIVTGWEWIGGPKDLKKATVLAANKSDCLAYHDRFPPDLSKETFLCAGSEHGDSCHGDAGAPLGYGANIHGVRFVQFGISFAGSNFCVELPSFYTNVSYYMDWIIANMKP